MGSLRAFDRGGARLVQKRVGRSGPHPRASHGVFKQRRNTRLLVGYLSCGSLTKRCFAGESKVLATGQQIVPLMPDNVSASVVADSHRGLRWK